MPLHSLSILASLVPSILRSNARTFLYPMFSVSLVPHPHPALNTTGILFQLCLISYSHIHPSARTSGTQSSASPSASAALPQRPAKPVLHPTFFSLSSKRSSTKCPSASVKPALCSLVWCQRSSVSLHPVPLPPGT